MLTDLKQISLPTNKKHNYQKYASILCEVDEITSSLAGLKLIRTGTITNGAKKCDFRFQKLN